MACLSWVAMSVHILHGHWVDALCDLRSSSVHCVVTSPPYWGLRSYLPDGHPLKAFELGSEPTLREYVDKVVEGFESVRRVLRDDGTLWLNLGDTYANDSKWGGATGGKHAAGLHSNTGVGRGKRDSGLKAKDLCGVPWRVAFALRDAGWYLRCDIIWEKPTAMPEPANDRPAKSHEYLFLLTKSPTYFYDKDAIMEPASTNTHSRGSRVAPKSDAATDRGVRSNGSFAAATLGAVYKRNKRSVWTIKAGHYNGAHYATFPPDLVRPCILAGTSEAGCCPVCGAPYVRQVDSTRLLDGAPADLPAARNTSKATPTSGVGIGHGRISTARATTGWAPSCGCDAGAHVPCVVLDPFAGTGTVGAEAERLGRNSVLIELNPESIALAEERTAQRGLFAGR